MASRLVFCDAQREVPSLSRGYRTPDPSPTKYAKGLPQCKPWELRLADDVAEFDQDAHTPRYCPQPAQLWFKDYKQQGPEADRTLSPPMSSVTGARTLPMEQGLPILAIQEEDLSSLPAPREDAESAGMSTMWTVPVCTPCHMPQVNVPQMLLPMMIAPYMPVREVDGEESPCQDQGTFDIPGPTWSAGSAGHPYCCAEPCKYMSKKRGCKDGADCDRCHLCVWKGTGARKTGSRAARKNTRD